MPTIDRIYGVADQTEQSPIPVISQLLPVLHAAGIRTAGDGRKLSNEQMDRILAGKSVVERIRIKLLVERSGIYPDQL